MALPKKNNRHPIASQTAAKRNMDRESSTALMFMLPLFVFLAVLILLPVLGTFWNSLMRDVPFLPRKFIGTANYEVLFADAAFRQSVWFTLLFVLVSVPLEILLGLIIALVLNESFPGRGLLRAAVLIPWAIPAAVSGRVFELVYHYSYGGANYLITAFGISDHPINWLGTSAGAFAGCILADAWKTTPFAALIILAGLSAIREDLYLQAQVDRTNFFQRFFYITLPLLKPVLVVALLFRTVMALRVFDVIFVLTGGGPGGATTALSLFAFRYFSAGDFGYGSAASVILFFCALIISIVYVKAGRFEESIQ
ncbi:MAG: sugar ABC transporter permease [Desulfobacterales bacterium]